MRISDPQNYKFVKFVKSHLTTKKYDAILKNKKTGQEKKVPFGDKRYEQFKDKALGIYKSKDHGDLKRRESYRRRHKNEDKHTYSSGYFAYKYLW